MKYRSLITENVPTKNRGVIYETGYFETVKQHLQPYIDAGTCFVSLDKGLSSGSDAVRYQDVALKSGLYAGTVKSIEVLNDVAIVDIDYFHKGYLNPHSIQESYEIDGALPDPNFYYVEFIVDVHDINKIKENNNHVTLNDLSDFYNVVKVRTW